MESKRNGALVQEVVLVSQIYSPADLAETRRIMQ